MGLKMFNFVINMTQSYLLLGSNSISKSNEPQSFCCLLRPDAFQNKSVKTLSLKIHTPVIIGFLQVPGIIGPCKRQKTKFPCPHVQ